MQIVSTIAAFLVALGVLIVFHELGHYFVARLAGIKILRFSVGFGTPIWSRRFGRDQTEWAIAAFPLGGYVKMLDEREGPVSPSEVQRAFNRQSVAHRFAVVVAGPAANFLLAIVLYLLLFSHGIPGLRPVVADALPGTPAAAAQLRAGDVITKVGDSPIATWQDLRWQLLEHAVRRDRVRLEVRNPGGEISFPQLDFSNLRPQDIDSGLLEAVGIERYNPPMPPVIGKLIEGGAAQRDGLKEGDRITAIDGKAVSTWSELVDAVRASPGRALVIDVDRADGHRTVTVTAESASDGDSTIGKIGAAPHVDEQQIDKMITEVRYPPVSALWHAVARTGEVSAFTLKMLGRMIVGDVSIKNLSGPITIADYAGQSAQLGWVAYLNFLALISISLGVLNLLPVPVLDGGHLMYYVVEIVKGSPVSDRALEVGQQVGIILLFSLMAFALYNDINRLFGG